MADTIVKRSVLTFLFSFCLLAFSSHDFVRSSEGLKLRVLAEVKELKSSYAPVYREQAKARLIQMGSDVLPYVIPFLTQDDSEQSFTILEIIYEIGDPRSAKAVLDFMERSDSVGLICQSIKTLGKLKSTLALPKLVSVLKQAPEDYFFEKDISNVVSVTLWSLGEMKDSRSIPAILKFAQTYPQTQYLVYIADALGKIADPRAKPLLLDLLKHRDGNVRLNAARSLKPFVESSMLKFLWVAFENESDFEVQSAITGLIVKVDGSAVIQKFLELLKSGQNYTSQNLAEKALKTIGEEAVPFILRALEQPDLELKVNCARVLAHIGTGQAIPKLADMAQEKNRVVQIAAIEGLGKCGDDSVLNLLTRLSISFNKSVRRSARSAKRRILLRIEQERVQR